MASGTVTLTGANGSAGLHAAEHLLKSYPQFTAIFTVRNASSADPNTNTLREVISRYPDSRASVQEVDNANLAAVHEFADTISAAIAAGQYPPLKSIICNASYWNLVTDPELTVDGYEKTIQNGHIAHVALVLRLVDSFAPDGGRIVLVSSVGHYRVKTHMSPFLPEIPDDIDQLIRPAPDTDKKGRGFQRYSTTKLIDSRFKNITVVTINPGGIGDSRCFHTNTPGFLRLQAVVVKRLIPVVNWLFDPTFRSAAEAGVDLVDLAVDKAHPGERGYFTLLKKDKSDPLTLDEATQKKLWKKSAEWAKITKDNTALKFSWE
ncbi:hypothetical protein DL767_005982 [Monosporascus sp. MG133]|nr:hypothetical protein DL767_005982 [Monosporascus sp. MG133]